MILTPPAMTMPISSMTVKSIEGQPQRLQPCKAKSTKPQPVKLMSADHKPPVVFDAIRQDERAWGMYECVSKRIENLLYARYDHEEKMGLWLKLGNLWSGGYVKYPLIPILAAAARVKGLTLEQYAAKHPDLLWELLCCWEWDEPGSVPISQEAARIMRYTGLMVRMIEKGRMKKSKKYQRLSRIVETLHYRAEETA